MANYLLRDVPPTWWAKVRRRARADGMSVRGLIIALLGLYLDGDVTLR